MEFSTQNESHLILNSAKPELWNQQKYIIYTMLKEPYVTHSKYRYFIHNIILNRGCKVMPSWFQRKLFNTRVHLDHIIRLYSRILKKEACNQCIDKWMKNSQKA